MPLRSDSLSDVWFLFHINWYWIPPLIFVSPFFYFLLLVFSTFSFSFSFSPSFFLFRLIFYHPLLHSPLVHFFNPLFHLYSIINVFLCRCIFFYFCPTPSIHLHDFTLLTIYLPLSIDVFVSYLTQQNG